MQRLPSSVLILIWLMLSYAHAQHTETLAEVLRRESVPLPTTAVPDLNSPITSFATLNDEREFLIAYYLVRSGDELRPPLFLTRLDKQNGAWQHRDLTGLTVKALEETDKDQVDCLGSVLGIQRDGTRYYLDLHLTPSAGCLLIVHDDLIVDRTIGGWTGAFFKSGLLVYFGNMVHFADVHPETLFLYDPVAHKSLQIFPPSDDPFRKNFSSRLSKVIDRRRCNKNNWACDPDRFTSDILHPIEVNDETHSLAFRVTFQPDGFLGREETENSGKWDDDDYLYIYRFDPIRWREFSVYDLKPMFGTDSLKELLTPARLQQVFATPGITPSASRHSRSARAR